jgi:hypothetical protein
MRYLTVLILVLAVAVAGCGSSHSSSSSSGATTAPHTSLAKTKFVLHAGLAFGAFHRYIYKPFRAGKLSGGLLHGAGAKIKAALAAAFAFHEVRLALDDARSSKLLSRVLSPLLALQTKLSSMESGLRHGDTSQVSAANAAADSAGSAARAAGQPISDQPTPSLGG